MVSATDPILQVKGIGKKIATTFQLHDVHFVQQPGQAIGIAGATGSGKSTLLKIIAGLEEADEGIAFFEDQKIKGPLYRLIPGQPGIAYLSQHYELRNHYRMEELLAYADQLPEGEADPILDLCRVRHLLKRKTSGLSGGEQQRIALARLLLTGPRLLLLDEPFSNLDLIHKQILKEVLEALRAQKGLSCILASHDPSDLLPWADTLLILKEGRLVQQGSPETIYHQPGEVYTAALLGAYNLLPEELATAMGLQSAPEGKQWFLRPEQLQLAVSKGKGIKATVQSTRFKGSYYEAIVEAAGHTIRVLVSKAAAPGTKLYLQVKEPELWALRSEQL